MEPQWNESEGRNMLMTLQMLERKTTVKFYEALAPANLEAVCKQFRIDLDTLKKKERPVDPPGGKTGQRQRRRRKKPHGDRMPSKQTNRKDIQSVYEKAADHPGS